ncbi:MAG TPA: AAA family ATPase [Gemmataceae bacterium]|nr:AAA family ATPase [Gemmataceae bacterium]
MVTAASVDCQLPALLDPLPDIIPACGISLLAGAPNVGKTALLASIARDFRDTQLVFGHQPNPLPAIGIIAADRGWARGGGVWFGRIGYADVRYYSMADDPHFDPRSLRRKFERTQRLVEFTDKLRLPPGSLLFVDPISLFLGGNLLDYDGCAVACYEIRRMLRERMLTLIATAHSARLKADKRERYLRLQDQILGSTAIFGFTDTQMYLAAPEETGKTYYTFLWNSHAAPVETFQLERDEHGLFIPWTGADRQTQARVLALLPEDGSETTMGAMLELAEAIPLSRRTVFRTIEALMELGTVVKVRHGVYQRVVLH